MSVPLWVEVVGPYVLVALLSVVWALAEIVQTFAGDVRRALRTGWAWLFIGGHVLAALLAYGLVRLAVPQAGSPWGTALAAGVSWQALLRTRVNLLQPIHGGAEGVPLLAFTDLYNRFQQFCRTQIDQALIGERIRLLEQATQLPLEVLERRMRLQQYASQVDPPARVEEFLRKIHQEPDEERRKLLIASYLLHAGGYEFLQAWLERESRAGGETR